MNQTYGSHFYSRHPRGSGAPGPSGAVLPPWLPAFAGMTKKGRVPSVKFLPLVANFRHGVGNEIVMMQVIVRGKDIDGMFCTFKRNRSPKAVGKKEAVVG
jgi:hypothetical protein